MRFALYVTPEWVARRCEQWEFIGYNETLADAPQQQWLVQFAQNRAFALVANDLVSIHRACQAGMGVALLPRFIVNGHDTSQEIVTNPTCDVEREIWLAVHPDVRRSPRVQAVADALAGAVRDADGAM
jgi:DNA-binding transcriptional LysR family regulator